MGYGRTLGMFLVLSALLVTFLQLGVVQAGAQSVTGTAAVILQKGSVTLYPDNSISIPVSVSMISGTAGKTTLSIGNWQILTNKGFSLAINNASGTPPYTATILVVSDGPSSITPGTYVLYITTSGADQSTGAANLTINVMNSFPLTSTTPQTGASTVQQSTIAATGAASAGLSGTTIIVAIIILIVLVVVIVLAIKLRKRY